MKSDVLFRALGDVGDDLIQRAEKPQRRANTWSKWVGLAACCVVILGMAVLSLPQWGDKSDAPAAPATASDMSRSTEESAMDEAPAEAAEAEAYMDAPAAAAPAEAPAEAPSGEPAATADAFEGRSEWAISFMYYVYEPATNNDPAHTAGESDGDLRGDLIGAVENSLSERLMGAEVYAYGSYDSNEYILVKDESREDPWVLYRAVK